jgi:hypothetical protein
MTMRRRLRARSRLNLGRKMRSSGQSNDVLYHVLDYII